MGAIQCLLSNYYGATSREHLYQELGLESLKDRR